MRSDASLAFVPPGSPLSLVGAAGAAIPSAVTVDLLGQGIGTAPFNIIGNATTFGADTGAGLVRAQLDMAIGIGLVTANGATLNMAVQGAPDTGAAGGYQPGTWQTLVETGQLTAAQCIAGFLFGRFDWPMSVPGNLRPRFMRLLAQVPAGTSFSAGTVGFAIVTTARDDITNRQAANNYLVR